MAFGKGVREAIRFGFSVGRVRVLEGRLLTNAALERLLDAEDFLAQKRVLADTEYGAVVAHAVTAADVEIALDGYLEQLFEFVETSGLSDAVVRFFRTGSDHRNLKGRLKAEALDVPLEGLTEPHGLHDVALFSGPSELLPERFRRLDAAARNADGSVDRLKIDPIVDRAMYEDMLDAARESGCDLLIRLSELDVDLANMQALLRAKRLGWSADEAAFTLVPGGTYEPEAYMRAYNLPFEDMVERAVATAQLSGVTAEDVLAVERLDVLADNLLMRLAQEARLVATGIEPVIGYVMARRSEVVILRMLLVGKIAGLSAAALRGRVRELYV